eukprot:504326-Amphidinium_carterae.2
MSVVDRPRRRKRNSDRAVVDGPTTRTSKTSVVDRQAYRQLHVVVHRFARAQQAQVTVLTGLQQELQRARAGNTRMDPLKLGRPLVFAGEKATCEDWAFKLKAFMGQESTTAIQWMREMESAPDALDFDFYMD